MKNPNKLNAYIIAMIVLAMTGLAACSSTGIQRSEKTTTTMQTMENDIKMVSVQLDATNASLDELMKPGQSDVKKAFDLYSNNVDKIESMEKDYAKHAEEMKSKGKDYFEEWQKEGKSYKNPEIQKLSDERRQELGKIYDQIAQNSVGVKEAFRSYVSDAKEIQMYLSNDLTSKGVASIAPVSQKVVVDGNNFKDAIKNVQTAIDRARAEMVQGGN
jgi:F0F1-type ATP synthase membrane subunit b/b'